MRVVAVHVFLIKSLSGDVFMDLFFEPIFCTDHMTRMQSHRIRLHFTVRVQLLVFMVYKDQECKAGHEPCCHQYVV